jgi:hypothetical protein
MEVGEYAMFGDDGVDIATRRTRARALAWGIGE